MVGAGHTPGGTPSMELVTRPPLELGVHNGDVEAATASIRANPPSITQAHVFSTAVSTP
jgi:hypothetical protein